MGRRHEASTYKSQSVDSAYIGLWPALINIKDILSRFNVTPLLPSLFLLEPRCICMLQMGREQRASPFRRFLILRVYLSRAVMLRSHDRMNHQQQLRLINHSFTAREGGTECAKGNQESGEREAEAGIPSSPVECSFLTVLCLGAAGQTGSS